MHYKFHPTKEFLPQRILLFLDPDLYSFVKVICGSFDFFFFLYALLIQVFIAYCFKREVKNWLEIKYSIFPYKSFSVLHLFFMTIKHVNLIEMCKNE